MELENRESPFNPSVLLTRDPIVEAAWTKLKKKRAALLSEDSPQQPTPKKRRKIPSPTGRDTMGQCFICGDTNIASSREAKRLYHQQVEVYKQFIFVPEFRSSLPPKCCLTLEDKQTNGSCASCLSAIKDVWNIKVKIMSLEKDIQHFVERARETIKLRCGTMNDYGVDPSDHLKVEAVELLENEYGEDHFGIASDCELEPDRDQTVNKDANDMDLRTQMDSSAPLQLEGTSSSGTAITSISKTKANFLQGIHPDEGIENNCDDNQGCSSLSALDKRKLGQEDMPSASNEAKGGHGADIELGKLNSETKKDTTAPAPTKEKKACEPKDPCPICAKPVHARFLPSHIKKTHKDEPHFVCRHCTTRFFEKQKLTEHLKLIHPEKKKKPPKKCLCSLCGTWHYNSTKLQRHVAAVHEGKTRYGCDKCPLRFYEKSHLIKHMKTPHIKPSLTCERCGRIFEKPYFFKLHQETELNCTEDNKKTRFLKKKVWKTRPDLFKPTTCPHCDCPSVFQNRTIFKNHVRRNHAEEWEKIMENIIANRRYCKKKHRMGLEKKMAKSRKRKMTRRKMKLAKMPEKMGIDGKKLK